MAFLGVFNDQVYNPSAMLPQAQLSASTQNGGVIPASSLARAQLNIVSFSGQTTAQALTTDTAANIISTLLAALQLQDSQITVSALVGLTLFLNIINNNTSSGAITLSGGTGVTISGTATVAVGGVSREFVMQITGPNSVTITNIGSKTA